MRCPTGGCSPQVGQVTIWSVVGRVIGVTNPDRRRHRTNTAITSGVNAAPIRWPPSHRLGCATSQNLEAIEFGL
jgi:hypothetical protein